MRWRQTSGSWTVSLFTPSGLDKQKEKGPVDTVGSIQGAFMREALHKGSWKD